jgi:HK97 family phage prohead protease
MKNLIRKVNTTGSVTMGATPSVWATTEGVDREGDRVIANGLANHAEYMTNALLLAAHKSSELPIGRVTSLVRAGDGWRASWIWNEADPEAARWKTAWDGGFLNAASIGFESVKSTPNKYGGRDHELWRLWEISLVPLPANAACVRALKSLGLIPGDEIVLRLKDEPRRAVRDDTVLRLTDDPAARRVLRAESGQRYQVDLARVDALVREATQVVVAEAVQALVRQARGKLD